MNSAILIIEDDKNLQKYLNELLLEEGNSVKILSDGLRVMEVIEKTQPDIVLLDLGLPNISGESVLKEIKDNFPSLPILVLTGKDKISDKVNAFELGADDYVTKPFSSEELIMRIKARLREKSSGEKTLKADDLVMNTNSMQVFRKNEEVELTPQEYKLLEAMLVNKNKVMSREALLNKIWPNSYDIETRVVDVYISYLRKKIDKKHNVKLIHSVRGFGYVLKES